MSKYQTEWIGKFGIACELARRNYTVSWPLGNVPILDVICQSPQGLPFYLQVKSFRQKGYIPIGSSLSQQIQNLWFVFVYVPNKVEEALEYYILPQQDLMRIREKEKAAAKVREQRRGKPYGKWPEGVYYRNIQSFKNRWDTLPK
jgi:hypothetical protein